ncbi:hypothetical protein ACHAWO_005198 [Cyclotella atomus]|uniref:Uncharacterized protein n=1 Tax=Cyclotella atomus TaxID=382360 RepID=A0ABD3MVD7_9STRA
MSVSFLRRASLHRRIHPSLPHPLIASRHDDDDTRCRTSSAPLIENSIHVNQLQKRDYHATPRQEILPLIAIGVVGIGIYSYRALKQMDEDWEEYYEKLDEYRRVTGIDPESASSGRAKDNVSGTKTQVDEMASLFKGGTLAIDMGTSKLKLAHLPSGKANAKPTVTVDREGARSTPSLIWMSLDDGDVLVGRMAEARLYDNKGGRTLRSRDVLNGDSAIKEQAFCKAVQQSIRMAASNALEQVLGGQSSQSTSPLFVVDESMAYSGSYNVRPVFTYPSCTSSEAFLSTYKSAIRDLTSPEGIGLFVPEPIAIVTGAESYNLLPANKDPVLVVDVGGLTTNISVVSNEEVTYSASIPFGGDTFVDLLTSHLIRDFYGTDSSHTGISTTPTLDDPSALQRIYEASATALNELSNKSRSQINIPYLSIDLQTKQPKHLEVGVARSIVDNEVQSFVRERLVKHLSDAGSASLSASLPKPTDLATLFSSTLASAMEQTSLTPFFLRAGKHLICLFRLL